MKEKLVNFISSTKGKIALCSTAVTTAIITNPVAAFAIDEPGAGGAVSDPFTGMTGTFTQYVTYGLAALGSVAAAGIGIFGLKWAFKQGKKFFNSVTS